MSRVRETSIPLWKRAIRWWLRQHNIAIRGEDLPPASWDEVRDLRGEVERLVNKNAALAEAGDELVRFTTCRRCDNFTPDSIPAVQTWWRVRRPVAGTPSAQGDES